MADRTFKLSFLGDASKAVGAVNQLEGRLSGLGSKVQSVAAGISVAAGSAIVGGLAYATKSAMTFEKAFSEVATLLPDLDASAIDGLRKNVLELSKETGIATDKVVPAFYQAISSGVPATNVMGFMRVASRAAIGGVTELETAVDGISTAVNSYGAENLSAKKAADLMFTTVKLGKTNFAQLSDSLFNVLPTANSLGVSFEDVSAALATMTLQGVPTSVATTQLRQALVETTKGGTGLDKAIRKINGGAGFQDLIKKGKTSSQILDGVRKSMPDQKFRDLFGSVEALNAALAITGDKAPSYDAAFAEMGKSAGALDKAFKTVSATTQYKFDKAMNSLKVSAIEFGTRALPYVTKAIEFFSRVMEGGPPKWLVFGAAIAGVVVAVSTLITVLSPIISVVAAVGGALLALGAGPALLIVAALAAIIAAGVLLYRNWDTIKDRAGDLWEWITTAFGRIADFVGGVFHAAMSSNLVKLALLFSPAGPLVVLWHFKDEIIAALSGLWEALQPILAPIMAFIGRLADAIGGLLEKFGQLGMGSPKGDDALIRAAQAKYNITSATGFGAAVGEYASGGIVPGPSGAPQLAIVHGGERVIPNGGGGNNVYVTIQGAVLGTSAEVARYILQALNDQQQRGTLGLT